ncbi:MAG: type I restriction enzyme HsdR N-terminal domain-containing protein [Bacteroidales bacterium]
MYLKELNLPQYSFKITGRPGEEMIFDIIRRKFVRLTPEEWVRQNFIRYLAEDGNYPAGLMGVEVSFSVNRLKKRADILVHNREGKPVMIIECKSYDMPLDEKVFDQIVTYNMNFRVPYLVVTNGMVNYACKIDHENKTWEYLMVIPQYEELIKESMWIIEVTCAIIRNEDNNILVVRKGEESDHPLKWEFPGGKTRQGETHEECIIREVKEELSMDIVIFSPLEAVEHDYGYKQVRLYPFVCDTLQEKPLLSEHIEFKWVSPDDLLEIDFQEADIEVVAKYLKTIDNQYSEY